MHEKLAVELERLLDELTNGAEPMETSTLARIGENIAKAFKVQPDEVAVLAKVGNDKFLKFILPEKLQMIGTIPLTSMTALAARTAREKKPEVINDFTNARHASVFEGVPLGRRHDELIHKIMSAPIMMNNEVVGVVQVSRKGRTARDAGPDFSRKDLMNLTALSHLLSRFIKLCQVA